MRKLLALSCALLTIGLSACNDQQITSLAPASPSGEGRIALNIKLGAVGLLARTAEMVPTTLVVDYYHYQSGQLAFSDTFSLSGARVLHTSQTLPSGRWHVSITGFDQRHETLYTGGSSFDVYENTTTRLEAELEARFSSIQVKFPVEGGVSRFQLRIDDQLWGDSLLPSNGGAIDSVILSHDYLRASAWGIDHSIRLEASGCTSSGRPIVYRLDTTIRVRSGISDRPTFVLRWAGEGNPPDGRLDLSVSFGALGLLSIQTQYGERQPGIPWNQSIPYGHFRDARDGKTYKTVSIGGQTWMAQNLDYHGTESQRVGYCYEYDSANCSRAGRLYNWAEAIASADTSTTNTDSNVTIKGVCPDGWHLPSKSEFQRLASYVGDSTSFGKRLKSSGGWLASGSGADEYGFRIVPSGYRWYDNLFSEQGESSYLRSSTGNASTSYGLIFSASSNTFKDGDAIPGQWYFSVRCVSDNY